MLINSIITLRVTASSVSLSGFALLIKMSGNCEGVVIYSVHRQFIDEKTCLQPQLTFQLNRRSVPGLSLNRQMNCCRTNRPAGKMLGESGVTRVTFIARDHLFYRGIVFDLAPLRRAAGGM